MNHSRERMQQLVVEIRQRRAALLRAWDPRTLDRVAEELSRRFDFDSSLTRALIREELCERGNLLAANAKPGRTRLELKRQT